MNIDHLKHKYSEIGLEKAELDDDPLQQFDIWFKEAINAQIIEVNAMNLATVKNNGQPTLRAVLLKSYDQRGFVFFTNYASKKANDIEKNPQVALQFLWLSLDRQLRIEGSAEKTSIQESQAYFATRHRENQLSAWASAQSRIVPSRKYLDEEFEKMSKNFEGKPVPLPPFWGGYRVKPALYEFWQGRGNRLSDRILYTIEDGKWVKNRLAP